MPYADNDGVALYWRSDGDGLPLLLIQGLGYTHEMWHRLMPCLVDDFRVISFDNRGVGASDVPDGPYSAADMADDAAAVLDAAGVNRALVFGVSMGGDIAQEVALRHPERVDGLMLGAARCGGPDAVLAEDEVLKILVARAEMDAEQGVRVLVPYIYDPATPRAIVEADIAIRLRTYPSTQGYSAQLAATLGSMTYERIGRITLPTLVVHGSSDRLIPPANGRDVARRIPGARFVLLERASHIFWSERPEETARLISELMAATGSREAVR